MIKFPIKAGIVNKSGRSMQFMRNKTKIIGGQSIKVTASAGSNESRRLILTQRNKKRFINSVPFKINHLDDLTMETLPNINIVY